MAELLSGKPKDALSLYAKLLGLKERRYPTVEEFPDFIILPSEALGDLENNIQDLNTNQVEKSQAVFFSNGSYKKGQVILGNADSIGQKAGGLTQLRAYFGEKALLWHHTHPPPGDDRFSLEDIIYYCVWPRISYIFTAASPYGISFLLQTDKSSQLPFTIGEANNYERYLADHDFYRNEISLLESLGFGYYFWEPWSGKITSNSLASSLMIVKRRV